MWYKYRYATVGTRPKAHCELQAETLVSADIPEFWFAHGGMLPKLAALGPKVRTVTKAHGFVGAMFLRGFRAT